MSTNVDIHDTVFERVQSKSIETPVNDNCVQNHQGSGVKVKFRGGALFRR